MTINQKDTDYAKIVRDNLAKRYGITEEGDIPAHLETLMGAYKIEARRAVQAVIQLFAEYNGIEYFPSVLDLRYMPNDTWATVEAKLTRQVASQSDKVLFMGTIGDQCGTIDIMVRAGAKIPDIKPGSVCRFENVVVNEYNSRKQIIVTSTSKVTILQKDISVREFKKAEAQ